MSSARQVAIGGQLAKNCADKRPDDHPGKSEHQTEECSQRRTHHRPPARAKMFGAERRRDEVNPVTGGRYGPEQHERAATDARELVCPSRQQQAREHQHAPGQHRQHDTNKTHDDAPDGQHPQQNGHDRVCPDYRQPRRSYRSLPGPSPSYGAKKRPSFVNRGGKGRCCMNTRAACICPDPAIVTTRSRTRPADPIPSSGSRCCTRSTPRSPEPSSAEHEAGHP